MLAFYETAASMFHRRTAKDVQRVAEERISDSTKQRGHPHFRARALAESAGRLLHLDPEASERAWRAAVAAATEVRDSDRPEPTRQLDTTFQADAFLPADPVPRRKWNWSRVTPRTYSAGALSWKASSECSSIVRHDAPVLLRALKTASDEQPRYRSVHHGDRRIDRSGDFDGAAAVIGGMRTDALGQVSQTDREDGLWRVALFEAELGRLRQARLTCPGNDRMKLECYTRILEAYQRAAIRHSPKCLKCVSTLSGD